jgi:hypothetical protein
MSFSTKTYLNSSAPVVKKFLLKLKTEEDFGFLKQKMTDSFVAGGISSRNMREKIYKNVLRSSRPHSHHIIEDNCNEQEALQDQSILFEGRRSH